MTLLLPLLLATAPASEQALHARAQKADRIAVVQVLDSSVHVPEGDVMKMTTLTQLQVEKDLKGHGPRRVELVQLGGKYGPWERRVPGDATFFPTERAVLFLRCQNPARPDRCVLLGLGEGKLSVVAGVEPLTVSVATASGPVRRPLTELVTALSLAPEKPVAGSNGAVNRGGKDPEKSR